MAHLVIAVSPERIAAELRAMTSRPGRRRALELLAETGLAREVLPEVAPAGEADRQGWQAAAEVVAAIDEPSLPQALATLAANREPAVLDAVASRLRLSNQEAKCAGWLHAAVREFGVADLSRRAWSAVQPWVADARAPLLADLLRARAACGQGDAAAAAWLTAQVERPRHEIDPPPLVTGRDLLAAGVSPGPPVGAALARIRGLQLDGAIATKEQALATVHRD
jgi:tRNA nucleotidyltransferase/poly(A) polymerase